MLLYNDDALNHCMTTLIVTLPQELPLATAQFDYVLTVDGRSVAGQSRVPLALLPPVANGDVVAVVPVRALSWHQVQLPKGLLAKNFLSELSEGSTPRLRAVLDGLLEDRLLDEPAQLHLALAPGCAQPCKRWSKAVDPWRASCRSLRRAGSTTRMNASRWMARRVVAMPCTSSARQKTHTWSSSEVVRLLFYP